jgi:hypothetical protein
MRGVLRVHGRHALRAGVERDLGRTGPSKSLRIGVEHRRARSLGERHFSRIAA